MMDSVGVAAASISSGSSSSGQHHIDAHQRQRERRLRNQPRLVNKPPAKPHPSDGQDGWARFLAAYRSGRWDISGQPVTNDNTSAMVNVNDFQGNPMTGKDYFERYGHLPAPQMPLRRRKLRHEALLRHGLIHGAFRPQLQRYVELAKFLFDAELVSLSFASADERHIIFIAADGPALTDVPQCASICSHALLLDGEDEVFVVPDTKSDWRFQNLFGEGGHHTGLAYRFHASAPIYLSSSETPCCNVSMAPVHAGRFSIFASKPRDNFDVEAGKRLLNLARMVEESMENEYLEAYATQMRRLQLDAAYITQSLDERIERRMRSQSSKQTAALAIASVSDQLAGSSSRRSSASSSTEEAPAASATSSSATATETVDASQPASENSILYDPAAMLPILEMMQQTLNCTNVFILDASNLRAATAVPAPVPSDVPITTGKRLSMPGSNFTGRAVEKRLSMSTAPLSRPSSSSSSSSSTSGMSISPDPNGGVSAFDRFSPQKKPSRSLWSPDYSPFKATSTTKASTQTDTVITSPTSIREGHEESGRTSFSMASSVVSIVASSGKSSLLPDVESLSTISNLQAWFDSTGRQAVRTSPQLFRRTTIGLAREWVSCSTPESPTSESSGDSRRSSSSTGSCPYDIHHDRIAGSKGCCCADYLSKENDELLAKIMPEEAQTCLAIAIFGQSASQQRVPLAMLCVVWDTERPINTSKLEFCKTLGIHLSSLALREQTSRVQRGQMNFIRTMQHELRTPLNGIMCISEALCDTLDEAADDSGDPTWLAAAAEETCSPLPSPAPPALPQQANQQLITTGGRRAALFAAQTLAPQLESIHVSSMMLQTILDDILSLDSMFQESTPAAAMGVPSFTHSEVLNVSSEIEDACREELRYFALQALRTYRATSEATPSTPSDAQVTPTVSDIAGRRPSTTLPASTIGSGAVALSPSSEVELGKQNTATVMARPPTVLVRVDPVINRTYRSDRIKLRKIVGKLVSNAIRFTSEKGLVEVVVTPITPCEADTHAGQSQRQGVPPMSTHSALGPSGDGGRTWIRIVVSDTGIGMSEDFIEHKYLQPFLKADQFAQGIGLGATVACVMVQSLGGSFAVQSRDGHGTQVSICLPLGNVAGDGDALSAIGDEVTLVPAAAASPLIPAAAESPISFRHAQFVGFDVDDGTKELYTFLGAHLRSKGIVVVEEKVPSSKASSEPELLLLHESAVLGTTLTSLPSRLGQSNVHTIVVLSNASSLQTEVESVHLVKQGPHALLRPPFGQETLARLDALLRAPRPVVIPTPVGATASESGVLTPVQRPIGVGREAAVQHDQNNVNGGPDYFSIGQTNGGGDTSGSTSTGTIVPSGATADDISAKRAFESETPLFQSPPSNASESPTLSIHSITSPASAKQQITASQALVQASLEDAAESEADSFRILVVEDNPINMRLITSVLRKTGHQFVEAHDGVQAVAQYKAFEPSVVLLDISLPLMDGFEACVAMRAHQLAFRPKIIAITALSTNEDKARGLNVCGMDAWHTKPISIKMLRANLVTWKNEWDASRSGGAKSPPSNNGDTTTPPEQILLKLPNGTTSLAASSSPLPGKGFAA